MVLLYMMIEKRIISVAERAIKRKRERERERGREKERERERDREGYEKK